MPEVALFVARKAGDGSIRPSKLLERAANFGVTTALTEGILKKAVENATGSRPVPFELSDHRAAGRAAGDVALVSINTVQVLRHFASVSRAIEKNFRAVVIGGQMPGMMQEYVRRILPSANIFIGECEESMGMVMADAQNGKQGLTYRSKPVDIRKNYVVIDRVQKNVMQPVEIGRGCAYNCTFCGMVPNTREVRTRDEDQVKEEIAPLKFIVLIDPNISSYPEPYLYNFFLHLLKAGKKWAGEASAGKLVGAPEIWDLMSRTCVVLLNGVEDLNGNGLSGKKNGRGLLEQRNGAVVLRSIIIGGLRESEQSVKATINAFRENNLTGAFHMMAPLPGSREFDTLRCEGRLASKDLALFDRRHPVIVGEHLQPGRAEQLYREVNRKAHTLRGTLKEIARIIRESESFSLATNRAVALLTLRLRTFVIGLEPSFRKSPGKKPELPID